MEWIPIVDFQCWKIELDVQSFHRFKNLAISSSGMGAGDAVFAMLATVPVGASVIVVITVAAGRYVVALSKLLVGKSGVFDFVAMTEPGWTSIGAYLVRPVWRVYGIAKLLTAARFIRWPWTPLRESWICAGKDPFMLVSVNRGEKFVIDSPVTTCDLTLKKLKSSQICPVRCVQQIQTHYAMSVLSPIVSGIGGVCSVRSVNFSFSTIVINSLCSWKSTLDLKYRHDNIHLTYIILVSPGA
jgi:hypothetical protein